MALSDSQSELKLLKESSSTGKSRAVDDLLADICWKKVCNFLNILPFFTFFCRLVFKSSVPISDTGSTPRAAMHQVEAQLSRQAHGHELIIHSKWSSHRCKGQTITRIVSPHLVYGTLVRPANSVWPNLVLANNNAVITFLPILLCKLVLCLFRSLCMVILQWN